MIRARGRAVVCYISCAFVRDQRVPLLFIECVCSDETARRRLAADAASGVHPARNRDDALYRRVKDLFEPITEPKIVVDTDRALEDYLWQRDVYVPFEAVKDVVQGQLVLTVPAAEVDSMDWPKPLLV